MTNRIRKRLIAGNYYAGQLHLLIERLDYVRTQLRGLEALPQSSTTAFRIRQKKRMITKFEQAIQERLAWHASELRIARDHGFETGEQFEPRQQTFMRPHA